jgi:DNA-binding beta-propeller fold protein YncE
VNEGNFNFGNASLSIYYPDSEKVVHQVFQQANNLPLGDVAQSMMQHNGNYYVVVNNSGKIEVLDTNSLEREARITGFQSPRHMAAQGNKALVTDLYANTISVVDLSSYSITGQIPVNDWTESIIKVGDKIFVAAYNSGMLLEVNLDTESITDTIQLVKGIGNMVIDKNGKLWVLCSGGIDEEIPQLFRINPNDNSIEQSFSFSSNTESPGSLSINPNGDQLYFSQ